MAASTGSRLRALLSGVGREGVFVEPFVVREELGLGFEQFFDGGFQRVIWIESLVGEHPQDNAGSIDGVFSDGMFLVEACEFDEFFERIESVVEVLV